MIATVRNIAARKGCESGLVEKKESRDRERVLVFLTNHSLILNPPVLKCGVEPPGRPPDGDRVWPKGSRCRYVIGTNLSCSSDAASRPRAGAKKPHTRRLNAKTSPILHHPA